MRSLIKSILVPLAAMGMAALFVQACGSDTNGGGNNDNAGCVAGSTNACTCTGSDEGVQVCNQDGRSYTACNCSGNTGDGGPDDGGSMTCVPGGSATVLCGNGMVDPGEQCDDGNCTATDDCTDKCKDAFCGDKIVQAGEEDCDDGQNEVGDMCPDNCSYGDAGDGGNPCAGKLIFAGMTTAMHSSQWNYMASLGFEAGTKLCQAIGAANVCDYEQLKEIFANPALHPDDIAKLQTVVTSGSSISVWVHRTTDEMVDGTMSAPGPGARCNDWVYPTNHIVDGEFVDISNANGAISGAFSLDADTVFTGDPADGHAQAGLPCGGVQRYIPCCFPICK
jgi:cysteine-rich repeat protein